MKNMFFALMMATSSLLCAVSNESISNLENIMQPLEEIENRCPCHHRRHRKCDAEERCNDNCCPTSIAVAYGNFYTEDVGVIPGALIALPIAPGENVILNQQSPATTNNLILLPTGGIQITQPGDYVVSFGLSGNSSSTVEIALSLDGDFPQPGSNISFPSGLDQLVSASTIVRVPFANSVVPAILSLVNNGSSDIFLSSEAGDSVTAFITIDSVRPFSPL